MPALLTNTSIRPYFAIVSETPFSTAASSATFIATAKASDPLALNSRAVASAASKLRSAITGIPPSAANRTAISLPMPLAAPVMIPTFPEKRGIPELLSRVLKVVEHHFAQTERQIGDVVGSRDDLAHRQPRDIAQRMLEKLDRPWTGPRSLQGHVFHVIAHQLANPRCAVDMRDDLEHEIRPGEGFQERRRVDLAMLEAHCRGDAQHRAVM